MNYYKQGDAANAEKIKAAFEKLGYNVKNWRFNTGVYYTLNGRIVNTNIGSNEYQLILNNHDYQELELPVEPKFKKGNWLYHNSNGIHPVLVTDYDERHGYQIQDRSGRYHLSRNLTENEYHLWSIADAKDGDVLVTDNGWTCIFRAFDGCVFSSYCFMDSQKWFCEVGSEAHTLDSRINGNIYPATRKQRDQFFAKMKEAGYTWDSEKKELKKIIEPKFEVGDRIKWINHDVQEQTITDIKKDSYITVDKYGIRCALKFAKQDEWELVPKTHYDIANFHAGMPVLVREYDTCVWQWVLYSHFNGVGLFFAAGKTWRQCIPFDEDTKHLLGTTDMPREEYINW